MAGAAFVIATDIRPGEPAWAAARAQAAALEAFAERNFGTPVRAHFACLPARSMEDPGEFHLAAVLDRCSAGASEVFVLPAAFDLNVWQRTLLGEELSAARRRHPSVAFHHDTVDPAHPFLVDCLAGQVLQVLESRHASPNEAGLLLVADGRGDPASRADSYRLMRLLWEQTGMGWGEVGFVRHQQPYLPNVLKRCLNEPRGWVLVPQCQWDGELPDYTGVMLADFQRANPESAGWLLAEPPREHPAIMAWLEQRLARLWQEKRTREAVRVPSAKHQAAAPAEVWTGDSWQPPGHGTIGPHLIGRARDSAALAEVFERMLPKADRYLVKVTWHGYAQGTFTSAAALDLLLGALPGKAIVLEGHTSSRNTGGLDIEWEAEAEKHRTWIRQQESEFLRRTGITEVLAKHHAQYLNVTEEWWDGQSAPAEAVQAAVGEPLQNPDLAGFVPAVLLEHRGTPLISFARFKGPTRLGISNLFGLIPHPLRTAWHGAAITDFAAVCCDLARIYGRLFRPFGLVEAFESAVRWNKQGLYRSRWGNYDLVPTDGLFTFSEGFAGADVLASRLQGQDVRKSAFFDVVRSRLGESSAIDVPLPAEMLTHLA